MIDRSPQMQPEEIEYIDDLLDAKKPEYCLEWGSGKSTVYFPTKHKFIKLWHAIEHSERWLVYVLNRMNKKNTVIHYKDFENYVNVNGEWDFILVDGRLRNKCLAKAKEIIKPDGIILLHDYCRDEYNEGISHYKKKEIIVEGLGEGSKKHKGLMRLWI